MTRLNRFLVSGMGDALATWFEAEACRKAHAKNMAGGDSTEAALALARLAAMCAQIAYAYPTHPADLPQQVNS